NVLAWHCPRCPRLALSSSGFLTAMVLTRGVPAHRSDVGIAGCGAGLAAIFTKKRGCSAPGRWRWWTHERELRRDHHWDRRGRGPPAPPPGAIGEAVPAAGAGGFPAPRAGELEPQAGVRDREVYLQGHLVRRRRQAVPAADPLLRRRRDQDVRRGPVPAAA